MVIIKNFLDYKPHLSGKMKCIICKHEWIGICPIEPKGDVLGVECPECGLNQGFYIYPVLPSKGDIIFICNCGGELFQRQDDNEATIENRLKVYEEQTAPLVGFYQQQNKLHTIKGTGDIDAITDAVGAIFDDI